MEERIEFFEELHVSYCVSVLVIWFTQLSDDVFQDGIYRA